MGIFDRLFNRHEEVVTSRDLKVALMGVKRERRKKQLAIKKMAKQKTDIIQRIKGARRDGNSEEVDYLYEEMQQLKVDQAYTRREAKILNLEGIGLKRYIRGLERLEKSNNRERVKDLMEKVQKMGLDEKLRGQSVDEEGYLEALNVTLEDIKMELEDVELVDEEDPDKARFLAEIDDIIEAEEEGNLDSAVAREERLRQQMEKETEEQS